MHLNRLLDELNEIVIRTDVAGTVHYLNAKGKKSFSAYNEESQTLESFLSKESAGQLKQLLSRIHSGTSKEEVIEFSLDYMRPGIHRLYTVVAVADDTEGSGPTVTLLFRERAPEADVQKLPSELCRQAFEYSTEGLGITDSEGKFVYVNPAFCKMCGYEAVDLIGQDGSMLSKGTDSRSDIMNDIVESLSNKGSWTGEAPVRKKDGTIIDTYASIHLIEHKEYGTFWAGLQRDITEERNLMKDLARSLKKAEAANEAKSNFLSIMNHELRTPLNAILGSVQVFSREGLNQEQLQMLNTINNAGNHLLHLISDILNLSKIESGRYKLSNVKFDIIELTRQIVDIYRLHTEGKPVEIIKQIAPDVPVHFHGDPVALRQIIFNLVSNAVKFTPEGKVTISLSWHNKPGEKLKIVVSDTGCGIQEDYLPGIFERFSQVEYDLQRQHEGVGIGLSIVKEFTELMQGSISVQSSSGKGSTFTCLLNIKTCPQWLIERPSGQSCSNCEYAVDERPQSIPYSRQEFLVIEDNPVNMHVLVRMLEQLGVEKIDKAETGEEAIAKIKAREINYDFVFLDLHLPDMDGFEISAKIKPAGSQERFKKPYIIAVSADTLEENIDRFLRRGVIDYLAKPVSADKLHKKLSKICRSKENELEVNYTSTESEDYSGESA